jgi:YHS domain-containing protein
MSRSQRPTLISLFLAITLFAGLVGSAVADSNKSAVPAVNAANRIGVKGYDPVAYFTLGHPVAGLDQYTYQWKSIRYSFGSAENLARFRANPEKYLPQYGGYCAYAMSINRIADIDPHRWAIVGGKLYLNNGFLAQDLWSLNKSGNIASADRNWPQYPKKPADK